ncbi:T9SS type B sorting domain-containing protein [Pinibacter aurantiacus]|uniref:Gliding motility-associated C-terminal domain-containing protein n=1 Tax=Pinibacter aurantiacus TaxID=2851599 RepID=A0A9E2W5M1_9BACT|nr:gliding motility-associated C-terminal domain-containing protein [Pinibacter aurantiacus]MBV4359029.1 gliding motility-associated C-terminal domain-containing protein [Pinibacter aurantiacus]
MAQTVTSLKPQSIVQSGNLTLDVNTINSTCGQYNGSIIVSVSGGTAPYKFTMDDFFVQNTGNYTNVVAGTHKISVTDANNETITTTVTVTNYLSPPTVKVGSIKYISNCYAHDASITLEASGGTPPYQYSMGTMPYQSSNVFSNLSAGDYIFFVKDANGCIVQCEPLELDYNRCVSVGGSWYNSVCANEGVARFDIYDPTDLNLYTYSLDDGINYIPGTHLLTNNSVYFYNLSSGMHTLYLKDKDGKIITFAITVLQSCHVKIDFVTVDAACKANDGVLTVNASNGTAPYEYSIDGINYQTSNVFSNLWSGNYNVSVRDANGVITSLVATVYDHCPVVTAVSTGETCALNDGTIVATGQKGTAPYLFSIDGVHFQSANTFTGLNSGTYTVMIKDANGFTGSTSTTVKGLCLSLTTTVQNTTCGLNNGSISVNAIGGSGLYQYSLDGMVFQSANIFKNLPVGSYKITVTDGNGKKGITSVVVSANTPPKITAVNIKAASCQLNDGELSVVTSGGTIPLTYSIDGTTFNSSSNFTGLTGSRNYLVTLKDADGCTQSQAASITIDCPSVTTASKNETCGSKNGTVEVAGSNGTPPYQYSIDGKNFQAGTIFSNLSANTYTVTIKDALNYANTSTVQISNICPTVTLTEKDGVCSATAGSITAVGANGTPPYQYSIDGISYQSGNVFDKLSSGNYTVTVRDANGLTNPASINVNNYPSPEIMSAATAASCINNDGTITISQTGGSLPFQYSLDGVNFQASGKFIKLQTGIYATSVKDVNGCVSMQNTTVPLKDNLTLTTGNDPTICEGKNLTLQPSTNATSFRWYPTQGLSNASSQNPVASPAVSVTYTLTAMLGVCTQTGNITVIVNPAPVAHASKDTAICLGQSVQLNGSGGTSCVWTPATFLTNQKKFDPSVTQPTSTTTYSLVVNDGNGCSSLNTAETVVTVIPIAKIFAGNDTAIVINQPLQLNAIDVNNSGFTKYNWTPTIGLNDNTVKDPVAAISHKVTYTVTASTPNGCIAVDDITVTVYNVVDIYVPSAFTPNSDGKNDQLRAIPIGIKEFKYFAVYDRWGKRIFFSTNPAVSWDGSIGGVQQSTGTYIWMTEGISFSGTVIKRKGTAVLIR